MTKDMLYTFFVETEIIQIGQKKYAVALYGTSVLDPSLFIYTYLSLVFFVVFFTYMTYTIYTYVFTRYITLRAFLIVEYRVRLVVFSALPCCLAIL